MDNPAASRRQAHAAQRQKLLVSGWVNLSAAGSSVEIARGMSIMSRDGQEVGKVAAVVVDPLTQEVTHILLCRLPESPDYRLAPLDIVTQVTGQTVMLQIQSRDVDGLAVHQPT
ncbi:MAG: PRC-barrel domain-containing protein [Chloroflexota bacterium]